MEQRSSEADSSIGNVTCPRDNKIFENKMLRRIFGPKKDEVTGGCRKLHNLYSSPKYSKNNQVKKDEIGRACSTHGGEA
jgi:hypothetical protein